jgi:TM2 domain-containing membrane protein YozV
MSTPPPFPNPIEEAPIPKISVSCPHCEIKLTVHPSQAGEVATCPKCKGKFQIPLPTATSNIAGRSANSGSPERQQFIANKMVAGILGIFFGAFGVHKFVIGLKQPAIVMLVVSVVGFLFIIPLFVMSIIGFIEGVIYLTKSDDDFYRTYCIEKKEWF